MNHDFAPAICLYLHKRLDVCEGGGGAEDVKVFQEEQIAEEKNVSTVRLGAAARAEPEGDRAGETHSRGHPTAYRTPPLYAHDQTNLCGKNPVT